MDDFLSGATLRIAAHSQRAASRPGPEVVSLASGDPSFSPPAALTKGIIEALETGYTHYVDGQGDKVLRTAIASSLESTTLTPITVEQVLITHGANSGLAAAVMATINPGDRVIIPEPTYSLYADLVHMVGGEVDFVPLTADFHLDLAAIAERAIGAKMVVLCHPGNPTGTVFTDSELAELTDIAVTHSLLVLADEAYDHIVFDDRPFTSTLAVVALQDRLIYCQTFSKTFAMTGLRLGYLVAPTSLIGGITRIHRTLTGPMSAAVQRGVLAALESAIDWPAEACREYAERRALVMRGLQDIPGLQASPPEGSFYVFVKYPQSLPSSDLARLAQANGVAIRPGSEFGPSGEGYFRLAFSGSREQLTLGLQRLKEVFANLS